MNNFYLGLILGIIGAVLIIFFLICMSCSFPTPGVILMMLWMIAVGVIELRKIDIHRGLTLGMLSTIGLAIIIAFVAWLIQKVLRISKTYPKCKECNLRCKCKAREEEICIKNLKVGDKIKFIVSHTNGKYHIETIAGISGDLHKVDFASGNNSVDGSRITDICKLN